MGAGELGITERVTSITLRQACAAMGQPLLMQEYRQAFAERGVKVAQVLLTSDVLANRRSYLNLRNSVEALLGLGVVPILNENDSVSTDEIGSAFGDNDTLSAYIASKIDADLLIILSDIDALYDDDPRKNPNAKPYRTVEKITPEIEGTAGAPGSAFAVGGMQTKIRAVKIAGRAGCNVIIASGREDRIIERILAGEELGTLFLAEPRMSARERWILNSRPSGRIMIDKGALKAIRAKKSLLPSGVMSVEGVFNKGDVILVNDTVKLVTAFNSSELESIMGKHSSEIPGILGSGRKEVIARPEDMVFLDR
jgi:glutamate 5-kinase